MLRFFRRSPALTLVLTLALAASPAAGAVCSHMGAPEAESGMAHEMGGARMASLSGMEAEMCHDAPEAPTHEHGSGCISPCCTADVPAPAPVLPVLDAFTVAPLAIPVAEAPPAVEVPSPPATPSPPAPALRVHLLLGRFLT